MQLLKNGKTSHASEIDRGEGGSELVEALSQQKLLESLEQLNHEFQEFEKIREDIRTRIVSIAQLVPPLNARKQLLENDIEANRKDVQDLLQQVPLLNQQKEDFLHSIPQKQEQQARLAEQIRLEQIRVKVITRRLAKLTRERMKTEQIIQQKQDEIAKIDEQLKQIESVQEYGIALVSRLLVASAKGHKNTENKHRFATSF